jgi:hypothetical protein
MIGTSEGITFYRCTMCSRPVSPMDIEKYNGCKCGNNKVSETNLSAWEKVVQVVKHPLVWRWKNARSEP